MRDRILAISIVALAIGSIIGVAALAPMSGETPKTEPAKEKEAVKTTAAKTDIVDEQRWVDSVFNSLSERQRVAQLFCPIIETKNDAAWRTRIKRLVQTDGVGGVLLAKGDIDSYKTTIDYCKSLASVPLLVTLDGEWGLSMRLKDATVYPKTMGLGAIANPEVMRQYGLETARQCRLLGINVNFAPVLDVNSNPANPVIGNRSLGENPERVAALGVAYSQGLEQGGVLSVAKHFPGHGDTSTDSHKTSTAVDHSLATLENVDLVPFKKYIEAGLSGIMVGHLKVLAMDKSGTPASLSSKITDQYLKQQMGFNGLVFTDALAMKGASGGTNNCVAALNAGADVLLGSASPEKDIETVYQAVKSGKVSKETVNRAVRKVLKYKYILENKDYNSKLTGKALHEAVNSPQADAINRLLSAAMITVARNDAALLPIKGLSNKKIIVVSLGAEEHNQFSRYCAKYADITEIASAGGTLTTAQNQKIADADIVITGVFSSSAATVATFARLAKHKGFIPVFFLNNLYKLSSFAPAITDCPTLVLAYDDTPVLRETAPQAIFGGIKVTGTVPVNVKNVVNQGDGIVLEKTRLGYTTAAAAGMGNLQHVIDSIVALSIRQHAVPGCQILIAKGGDVIVDSSYGNTDYINNIPVTEETIYDLASVSKATGTLSGIMKAYDDGLFKLDDRASDYIPGLKESNKKDLKIREFLFHETGLQPSLNMFELMMDPQSYTGKVVTGKRSNINSIKIQEGAWGNNQAVMRSDICSTTAGNGFDIEMARGMYVNKVTFDTIMQRIYDSPVAATKKHVYSCLNFCLLMDLEQRVTGQSHDRWVADNIFIPLGATHLGYRPREWYNLDKIAPTEVDNYLRRQTIHGYVHDELAAFSGGLQGNAGLFGNANDLAKLMQMWLFGGSYGGERILSEATVREFTTTVSPTCRRGLGFDMWDINNGKTRYGAPASTFGHTGFTGTAFWVDPENDIIFIYLSNRVNPSRDNKAFSTLSPRNEVYRALYNVVNKL